jgi:hypothetical protein
LKDEKLEHAKKMSSFSPLRTRAEKTAQKKLNLPEISTPLLENLEESEDEKVVEHRQSMY